MRLAEVCNFQNGFAFKNSDYVEAERGGLEIFRMGNILRGGGFNPDGKKAFVSEEQAQKLGRFLLNEGDILMCMTDMKSSMALLGHTAWMPVGGRYLVNQRVGRITVSKPDLLDRRFLYYHSNSPVYVDWLRAHANSGVQVNLSTDAILNSPVPLPPLPIQRRIAGILSAYDELIENSQRRIKILESMARSLYREALGTGNVAAISRPIADSPYWRFISENVSNYAGTKRYYATADVDGLAVTGPGIDYAFADKPSRAQKQPIPNSVWFARMKATYKIAWYGPLSDELASGVMLSSGFAGFEAKDTELWPLLFLTISSKEFHVQKDLYCTGATQMSLTNEGLARIMLCLPDEYAARWLGRKAGPMLNAIASLQRRNENLRRTRDLLLPRLLSGQIDLEAIPA
ncbi:MAG: restriction endonuclease subunit S [Chitinophagaceae bacterium]|nr:restriction endonuclease subunit S [Chitinophagaceae bacterium]